MTSYRVTIDVEVIDETAAMKAAQVLADGFFDVATLEDAALWVVADYDRLENAGIVVLDTRIEMLDPPIKGHKVVHTEPEPESAEP